MVYMMKFVMFLVRLKPDKMHVLLVKLIYLDKALLLNKCCTYSLVGLELDSTLHTSLPSVSRVQAIVALWVFVCVCE